MDKQTIIDLYIKEREYQENIFGNYKEDSNLNLASFLEFVEEYLERAKAGYVGKWRRILPPWMKECKESVGEKPAPVDAYEDLIKVFALAGAALETYLQVDVDRWRDKGIKNKWLDIPEDNR